jgi:hypothetical protein
MNGTFIVILIFLTILNCNNNGETSKKIDFNLFEITVPNTWNKIDLQGIDSYVGGFTTESGDTISFDYGKYTYDMDEALKVNDIKEFELLDSIGFDTDELHFSEQPNIDENQGTFHNEYYKYDTINNFRVKISIPKYKMSGTTGIFFREVTKGNDLFIHGTDLSDKEQKELLKSFETIKIAD